MKINLFTHDFFKIDLKKIIIVLTFLGWFFAYMLADELVEFFYPMINLSGDINSVENFKILLNFIMAFTVLCITLKDRYQAFEGLSERQTSPNCNDAISNEEFIKETDKQLIPFIVSLVPFSSAAMDLGDKYKSPFVTLFYIVLVFLIINILDIKYLFKFVDSTKLPFIIFANFIVYAALSFMLAWLFFLI